MILNIHSDASCLLVRNGRSRACGHFFVGWMPKDGEAIRLNRAFFTLLCTILKFVTASAAEAELGALFMCVQEGTDHAVNIGRTWTPTPDNTDPL